MAQYTYTHTCGHTGEVTLYGKSDERQARIARLEREDCPACRARGADLTGSVKQVAWALDIRAAALPKAEAAYAEWTAKLAAAPAPNAAKAHVQAALDNAIDAVRARTSAKDWIDGQHPDLDVYQAMRTAMAEAAKLV